MVMFNDAESKKARRKLASKLITDRENGHKIDYSEMITEQIVAV